MLSIMATYSYTLSIDFSGNINYSQFHNEIVDEAGITPILDGITRVGNNIDIVFNSSLSAGEQIILDGLVSSHVPVVKDGNSHQIIVIGKTVTNKNYKKIAIFEFPGSAVIPVSGIKVVASGKASSDYSLRIEDITNNNTIAECTFINEDTAISSCGTLTNISLTPAMWEVYGKVSTGGNAIIESISLFYN